ncbi:hypothetical protein KTN05_13560 [Paracoccus sp. Z118]|uniref:hypothetical protein n=1 Tax=Paracoccus sp. Z118 TaxID=2851017 RepID=UPI001C2B95C6|nr:hypothetical protein [Paracoccus sp. Z118]MBV0892869.1 hypothetical protein [Paracoccus sp. Z118]
MLLLLGGQSIHADELDRMQIAGLSSSERLRLRAYGQALTAGKLPRLALSRMRQDMTRQGYYFAKGRPELVARGLEVAPLLAWDGNINGGLLQDRFVLNGLTFEGDPDFVAKSGLVAGLSAASLLRYAWGTGRLVEFQSVAEFGWSPKHNIGRTDLLLSACSRNHLQGWSFFDLCATGRHYWRELDEDTAWQVSAAFTQIAPAPDSLHEIKLEYLRASTVGSDQDRLAFSVESVWRRVLTEFSVTFGEPLEDTISLRYRADARVSWISAGRGWNLDAWTQRAEGGMFLGVPREDRAHGIGLATDLRPGTSLRLAYLDSRSTAGIANYDQVTLDIRFRNLRW